MSTKNQKLDSGNGSGMLEKLSERLKNYSGGLERIFFGVVMLGLLDVTHIWLQKNRGFEGGCSGFGSIKGTKGGDTSIRGGSGEGAFDCAAVTSGMGSELFGVSNITWGLLFYGVLAGVTVGMALGKVKARRLLQGGRSALLAFGVLYSGYLTFLQFAVLDSLCGLCLLSAVIASVLFGIQAFILSRPTWTPQVLSSDMGNEKRKSQLRLFQRVAIVLSLLVAVDLVYFGGFSIGGGKAKAVEDGDPQCEMVDKPPVAEKGRSLLKGGDIAVGPAGAKTIVIEYFDPNCPHCKDFHETLKPVIESHKDEVRFVFKPFPLSKASLPEIQALYIAEKKGKYNQMLEGLYEEQGQGGIEGRDIAKISESVGIDPTGLLRKVNSGKFQEKILEDREEAINAGVEKTPTLLVDGRFTKDSSRGCIEEYISR
jgi:protein-disulfide isomerase/uncharacterized membrane protein